MRFKIAICALAFLLISTHNVNAQDTLGNVFDGPYLLYKENQLLVKEVTHAQQKAIATEKSYKLSEKQKLMIKVKFSNAPEKNFEVKLKSSIGNEPSVWAQPDKLLFLSDIEGEFDALRNLLLANQVINKKYEWIFGKGHLVICGDLFDRGKDVPATLWLLYKLEEAAKAKGGYVHTILGNHDIMNLAGNLKYLDKKYLTAAEVMGQSYMELYDEHTELGRWLRSKNLIEKIGDNLCLHGGVSPEINELKLTVPEINTMSKPYIGWKDLKNTVKDDKILKIFSSTLGLFWFRGYFKQPALEESVVDQTLAQYQVKKIIVGHTILKSNVGFYYGGKVLGVDVNQHGGQHEGALFEKGNWYKVDLTGNKKPINLN